MTATSNSNGCAAIQNSAIIVRATRWSEPLAHFIAELRAASGLPVFPALDSRYLAEGEETGAIRVDRDLLCQMGLYCPGNFAWRCGDYVYYLARQQHPEYSHIWLIEHDVRFSPARIHAFFECFSGVDVDFLSALFNSADPKWYWYNFALARDAKPYSCFFPVTRLSGRAIDSLRAKRREHSRQWWRRILWPNDEIFVATTAHHAGLSIADINEYDDTLYDGEFFQYNKSFSAADYEGFLMQSGGPAMFHPVLYGEEYYQRVKRLAEHRNRKETGRRFTNRLKSCISRSQRW